jgi:hypothetical protein
MTLKTCNISHEYYYLDAKKFQSRSPSPEDAVEAVSMSSCGSVDSDEEEEQGSCSSSSGEEEEESATSDEDSTSSSESEESAPKQGHSERDLMAEHSSGIPLMVQINTTEDSLCGESKTTAGTSQGGISESDRSLMKPKSNLRRHNTDPATSAGVSSISRREALLRDSSLGSSGAGSGSIASGSAAQSSSVFSASMSKRHSTASGLPPSCQLRDAQFLKLNFPESHWAPDIKELEHLESLTNVQCTMVCSYDPSIRETFWVTLTKVLRKKRATGVSQICVGYVKQDLSCCDLPRGSQVVLMPKHVQKVDNKSSDILFQKLMEAEQKREEMRRIRPVLPEGGPVLPSS